MLRLGLAVTLFSASDRVAICRRSPGDHRTTNAFTGGIAPRQRELVLLKIAIAGAA